jgi:hypothetical protein
MTKRQEATLKLWRDVQQLVRDSGLGEIPETYVDLAVLITLHVAMGTKSDTELVLAQVGAYCTRVRENLAKLL